MRPILFVNRKSDSNIGDQLASPLQYFRKGYAGALHLEVHVDEPVRFSGTRRRLFAMLRDNARAVVIGGGGLLGIDYFKGDLDFWCAGTAPTILWGAGHNSHDVDAVAEHLPTEVDYGQLLPFAAIGLRDWGPGFTWVPCASAMHPAFDAPARDGNGVVFALHRDWRGNRERIEQVQRSAGDGAVVVFNDDPFEQVVGALRNARAVVTNSFHAAYWGTLLGKRVAAIGGGTKVRLLKHPVVQASIGDWKQRIEEAPMHPHALVECRERNVEFDAHVRSIAASGASAGRRRPYSQDPIAERAADFAAVKAPLIAAPRGRVPKIIHLIFGLAPDFGGKPFNIMHYLAVRSMAEKIRPDAIYFHHEHEPDNEYFERIRPLLTLNRIKAPDSNNGRPIRHFAHKADLVRMQTLRDMGGIYMDLDTITVASFDALLDHSFTIGLQGHRPAEGLCNAVMLAAPGDAFVTAWLKQYDDFSDEVWDRFSVKMPYLLWRSGKHAINVERFDRFHWPLWSEAGLRLMFEEDRRFPNALCHHLWESKSYPRYFARYASFEEAATALRGARTSYAHLAREYL